LTGTENIPITAKEARLKKILEEELVDPDKLMNKNKKQSRSIYDNNTKIISKKGRTSYNTLDLRTTENLGDVDLLIYCFDNCIILRYYIHSTILFNNYMKCLLYSTLIYFDHHHHYYVSSSSSSLLSSSLLCIIIIIIITINLFNDFFFHTEIAQKLTLAFMKRVINDDSEQAAGK